MSEKRRSSTQNTSRAKRTRTRTRTSPSPSPSPSQTRRTRHTSFFYHARFNEELNLQILEIANGWSRNSSLTTVQNVCIDTSPFKHCIIESFMKHESYVKELRSELLSLEFLRKESDLYQFRQTRDLSSFSTPLITKLKEFLLGDCRVWVQKVTGLKLEQKVSMTCSSYGQTDRLLCHDDKCDDRKIAFILYLNEDWEPEFGGELQLFDTDEQGEPNQVVKSIGPSFNTFVFFEVARNSFHQVAEVVGTERTRLSINGWFHGHISPESKPVSDNAMLPKLVTCPVRAGRQILSGVNPLYFGLDMQQEIKKRFVDSSEIQLRDFLNAEFYKEISESLLTGNNLVWRSKGPANRSNYEILQPPLPIPVKKLVQMMTSIPFFKFLEEITATELFPVSDSNTGRPYCCFEVQQWKAGFYTLMYDDQTRKQTLDILLYFNVEDITNCFKGGYISYVDRDDNEELLVIDPSPNALCLTFKDTGTVSFVNYVNHHYTGRFQVFHIGYCDMSQFAPDQ